MALVLKSTYKVEVETPDGNFYCTFKRKKQNEALEDARQLAKLEQERKGKEDDPDYLVENLEKMLALLGDSLVKIEGLTNEDGSEVTVEDFRKNDLYGDIVQAIIKAQSAHNNKGENAAKKP